MRAGWKYAWAAWLAATTAGFAWLETAAYKHGKHPTLSRCLARWLGVQPRKPWGRFTPGLFIAAGSWLAVHIARVRPERTR